MNRNRPLVTIRPIEREDLTAALLLQSQTYPAYLVESEISFASRLNAIKSYCLTATADGQLAGYLLAHGWQRNSPPQLGEPLVDETPAEILFIHDLAVASSGRGLGIGRKLIDHALELALRDDLNFAELVAVEGAAGFWQAIGFADLDTPPEIAAKLASYGRCSSWMGRAIG